MSAINVTPITTPCACLYLNALLTAPAYELVIGTPERFHCGKQIASYLGLVPEEKSSGERRRLGHISKQGNVLLVHSE